MPKLLVPEEAVTEKLFEVSSKTLLCKSLYPWNVIYTFFFSFFWGGLS